MLGPRSRRARAGGRAQAPGAACEGRKDASLDLALPHGTGWTETVHSDERDKAGREPRARKAGGQGQKGQLRNVRTRDVRKAAWPDGAVWARGGVDG